MANRSATSIRWCTRSRPITRCRCRRRASIKRARPVAGSRRSIRRSSATSARTSGCGSARIKRTRQTADAVHGDRGAVDHRSRRAHPSVRAAVRLVRWRSRGGSAEAVSERARLLPDAMPVRRQVLGAHAAGREPVRCREADPPGVRHVSSRCARARDSRDRRDLSRRDAARVRDDVVPPVAGVVRGREESAQLRDPRRSTRAATVATCSTASRGARSRYVRALWKGRRDEETSRMVSRLRARVRYWVRKHATDIMWVVLGGGVVLGAAACCCRCSAFSPIFALCGGVSRLGNDPDGEQAQRTASSPAILARC